MSEIELSSIILTSKESDRTILRELRGWMVNSKKKSWMHDQSSRYYKNLNFVFVIPIISLSTIAGTLNLTSAASGVCSENNTFIGSDASDVQILQLVLGLMGLSTAVLTAVYNYMRIGGRNESHDATALAFEKLAREIRVEGLLEEVGKSTYSDTSVLLKELQTKFDDIEEKAPLIPTFVENKLARMLHKTPTMFNE